MLACFLNSFSFDYVHVANIIRKVVGVVKSCVYSHNSNNRICQPNTISMQNIRASLLYFLIVYNTYMCVHCIPPCTGIEMLLSLYL